jgi:hypothetical protein
MRIELKNSLKNYEGCDGCLSNNPKLNTKCCALGARYKDCPCKKCIIKGVCQARCEDLENFETEITNAIKRMTLKFHV